MSTFTITAFAPTDVTNLTTPGPAGAFPAIGDEFRLSSDWSNSTHARRITITDDDAILSGDPSESDIEDASQQTAVVTDANGMTVASGFVFAEYAFVVEGPDGATLTVYSIYIDNTLVGYGADRPVQPGANYLVTNSYQPNGSQAPRYKSFNPQKYEQAPDNSITGTDRDDSLKGGTGNDTITARGGNDTVRGGEGNDSINGGTGNDMIFGDAGADTLIGDEGDDYLFGGDGDDVLHGQEGNDTLFGEAGDDSLRGSIGDDHLSGGAGRDTLVGGEGNDTLDGGADNDTIYGQEGDDSLTGGDGDDYLSGSIGNDTLKGDQGNDLLYAGDGNDSVVGGVGNDTLHGERGNDIIEGKQDRDLIVFEDEFGHDTVSGGEGGDDFDTIDLSQLTAPVTVTYTADEAGTITDGTNTIDFTGIERIITTDHADFVDGRAGATGAVFDLGAGNDTAYGTFGNDSISGGDGDDFIDSWAGTDTIDGGAGNDTLLGGNDADLIYGGAGNDFLQGWTGNDTLYGGAGNDTLQSWEGNELLDGGDGADTFLITEGSGDNTIIGGEGGNDDDTIDLSALTRPVTVVYTGDEAGTITGSPEPTAGSFETNTFSEVERLILTDGDDSVDASSTRYGFAGDAPGVDIDARGGDDTVIGGRGGDTVDGGAGLDLIDGGYGDDSLSGGDGDDTITGGEGNDTIHGGAGADSIDGGLEADTIFGGAGYDEIHGGAGDDFIDGGSGDDTIDGGSGDDTIDGGVGDDFIEGGAGNDVISGGDGYDELFGGDGNDWMDGGASDDMLVGGDGIDTILGGDGHDWIDGGAGDDVLEGGSGDDTIHGGTGDDFVDGGTGHDVLYGDAGKDELYGDEGNDTIYGGADDDYIDGGAGNDDLHGGDGDDFLWGGTGDDTLTGGAGNDVFYYSRFQTGGNDTITDFNTGNTGTLNDGDSTNNDFIDLSGFYDHISELHADFADDNILNQSNAASSSKAGVDYSNNDRFGSGSITFREASANSSSFTQENTGVVCFTSGTAIRTPRGDVLIDELRIGDLVTTLDNGPQRIRWIGRRTLDRAALLANPNLRPILIRRGVLGAERDLLVSPQHGLLVGGGGDYLARAKHLAEKTPGIRVAHGKRCVTYVHLMFDAHQIVFSENTPSESFYPGPMALRMMESGPRDELFALFPELSIAKDDKQKVSRIYGDTSREFAAKAKLVTLCS